MQIPLRERDLDAFLPEGVHDGKTHFASGSKHLVGPGDVKAHVEIQRAVAEVQEQDERRRVGDAVRVCRGALEQGIAHQLDIGSVGDPHRNIHPGEGVLVSPVDHRGGQKLGVGNDHRGALKGLNLGGAHVDPLDVTLVRADLHPVADFHRPLHQQNKPRDEVVDDVL